MPSDVAIGRELARFLKEETPWSKIKKIEFTYDEFADLDEDPDTQLYIGTAQRNWEIAGRPGAEWVKGCVLRTTLFVKQPVTFDEEFFDAWLDASDELVSDIGKTPVFETYAPILIDQSERFDREALNDLKVLRIETLFTYTVIP